jgi:hypothetical protein
MKRFLLLTGSEFKTSKLLFARKRFSKSLSTIKADIKRQEVKVRIT